MIIGKLLGAIGGLATTYLDGKVAVQKANAEIPLILAFCGDWGNQIVQAGFTALEVMPTWYQYSLGGIVSASIGMRSVSKFFGK